MRERKEEQEMEGELTKEEEINTERYRVRIKYNLSILV